jgi:tetratricopeptide (TPR) repeat protein
MHPTQQADFRDLEDAYRLLAEGALRESAATAESLLKRFPDDAHVWHLVGGIYLRAGQLARALRSSHRAMSLKADVAAIQIQYGQCLATLGNRRAALDCASRARTLSLATAADNDQLGTLLTLCDEPALALPYFQTATRLSGHDGRYHYNLATAQRMLGAFAEAEASLEQVLTLEPAHGAAQYLRSQLRRQTPAANHVASLSEQLDKHGPTTEAILLEFALAKELEDLARDKEAFRHLDQANRAKRSTLRYEVQQDTALMEQIIGAHTREVVSEGTGHPSTEPIFIFGLPRSGTTLFEQMLASHSEVSPGGELPAFPFVLTQSIEIGARGTPANIVGAALELHAADLGRAYIEATRPQTGGKAHFTDKLPFNYLYAGLIGRALPNAHLIAMVRDPLDSCYAMYKTLFASGHYFTYDLLELARYYAGWHRLMRHWQAVLGERVLIVTYEDLVTAPQQTVRSVLSHCQLPWQEACLRFFERPGSVTTASAAQVRQPLYTSSIGRWRRVESGLRPLIEILDALCPQDGWGFARQSSPP